MRIFFYAPFKPLDHPRPSGDWVIATGLYAYMVKHGHAVQTASSLRCRWIYWKPWLWMALLWERRRVQREIARLRPETGIDIARFVQAVAAEGVPISRRYPTPLPQQPVFRGPSTAPAGALRTGLEASACPVAERLAGELFTLLVHPTVTTADLDDVAEAIRKVVRGLG